MKKTTNSLFLLFLIVNACISEISGKSLSLKKLNRKKLSKINISDKNSLKSSQIGRPKLKVSLFKRKITKRFSKSKIIDPITISVSLGLIIATVSALASAVFTVSAAIGISVGGLSIIGIGAGFKIGEMVVTAIIDAIKRNWANKMVQLYTNQLLEKNKLCYGIKNLNSIMDDMFELALLKNGVDKIHAEIMMDESELKSQFLTDVALFEKTIEQIWDSGKEFETLVCAKSIDFVGETSFFKNQISRIDPQIYSIGKYVVAIFELIGNAVANAFPFVNIVTDLIKTGYEYKSKLKAIDIDEIKNFFQKFLFGFSDKVSSVDNVSIKEELEDKANLFLSVNRKALNKKLADILDYNELIPIELGIIPIKIQNSRLENFNFALEDDQKVPCGFNPICIYSSLKRLIESISDHYKKVSEELTTLKNLEKDTKEIVKNFKKIGLNMIFESTFLNIFQKYLQDFISNSIQEVIGVKKKTNKISFSNSKRKLSSEDGEGEEVKKDYFSVFSLLKEEILSQVFEIKLDFGKLKDLSVNYFFIYFQQESTLETLNEFQNAIESLENAHSKFLKTTGDRSKEQAMVENSIKSILVCLAEKILDGTNFFYVILINLFTSILKNILGNQKANILRLLDKLSVLSGKILEFIPLIMMVYSLAKNIYNFLNKLYSIYTTIVELSGDEKLARNYNIIIVEHVNYLLQKYAMFSLNNLERINTFIRRDTIIKQAEIEISTKNDKVQVKKALDIYNATTPTQIMKTKAFVEKVQMYIQKVCHRNPNFAYKNFTHSFITELFGEIMVEDFYQKIQKIYLSILYGGPISDLIVVNDNLLDAYGFALYNPGYRMFRNLGSFNTEKDLTALLYCRGCVTKQKLAHIEFTEGFSEDVVINKMQDWINKGNSDSKCQKSIISVDNTYVEFENEKEYKFKYSYMRTCLKKIDIPPRYNLAAVIPEQFQDTLMKKIYVNESEPSKSYTIFPPQYFTYVHNAIFPANELLGKGSIQCDLLDKSPVGLVDTPIVTIMKENIDVYFFKSKVDWKTNCIVYISSSSASPIVNQPIATIRDNYILLKLHRRLFYEQKQASINFAHLLEAGTEKDKFISAGISIEGKPYKGLITEYSTPEPTDVECYKLLNKSEETLTKEIATTMKVTEDNTLVEKLTCFSGAIQRISSALCEKEKSSDLPAKPKEKIDDSKLPIEGKMLVDPKYEDISKFIFNMKVSWNNNIPGLLNCDEVEKIGVELKTIPKEYQPLFNLFLQFDWVTVNSKGLHTKEMKFYEFSDILTYDVTQSQSVTFQMFKDSLKSFEITRFSKNKDFENFIPFFYDLRPVEGFKNLPSSDFYSNKALYGNKFEDQKRFNCIKKSTVRLLFPLLKTEGEDFYLKRISKMLEFEPNVNLSANNLYVGNIQKAKELSFSGTTIDDIPKKNLYFVEFFAVEKSCNDISQKDLDYDLRVESTIPFILLKQYLPYYPRKFDTGFEAVPPTNLLFQFPFYENFCFATRIWISLNYQKLQEEKTGFCLKYNFTPKKHIKKKIKIRNQKL